MVETLNYNKSLERTHNSNIAKPTALTVLLLLLAKLAIHYILLNFSGNFTLGS